MNIEYDILSPEKRNFSRYRLVLVPVLYSAPEPLLHALDQYVEEGGTLLVTFRSCYTNEFYTIGHYDKPHILERCLGITYQEYTVPNQVGLTETEWFACSGCMAQLSGKEREAEFPICIQKGVSSLGKQIYYYFNYSGKQREQKYLHGTSIELLEGKRYRSGETIHMLPWSVYIFREEQEDEKQ